MKNISFNYSVFSRTAAGLVLALLVVTTAVASAGTVVFFDDFGSGANIEMNPSVGSWSDVAVGVEAVADSENWFGRGTDNGILALRGPRNPNLQGNADFSESTNWGTISMDVYEEPQADRWFQLRFGPPGAVLDLRLEDGGISRSGFGEEDVYPVGEVFRLEILYNSSANSHTYGDFTLPAQAAEVYINGVHVASNEFSGIGAWNHLNIRDENENNGFFFLDNLTVTAGEFSVIPEPGTLALLGLAGLLLMKRRRV